MKIYAPFAGIVHYRVQPGEAVQTGQVVAIVEAVKLEANVIAPGPGVVDQLLFADFSDCDGGDALLELAPHAE